MTETIAEQINGLVSIYMIGSFVMKKLMNLFNIQYKVDLSIKHLITPNIVTQFARHLETYSSFL